jgi:hypothetical protein
VRVNKQVHPALQRKVQVDADEFDVRMLRWTQLSPGRPYAGLPGAGLSLGARPGTRRAPPSHPPGSLGISSGLLARRPPRRLHDLRRRGARLGAHRAGGPRPRAGPHHRARPLRRAGLLARRQARGLPQDHRRLPDFADLVAGPGPVRRRQRRRQPEARAGQGRGRSSRRTASGSCTRAATSTATSRCTARTSRAATSASTWPASGSPSTRCRRTAAGWPSRSTSTPTWRRSSRPASRSRWAGARAPFPVRQVSARGGEVLRWSSDSRTLRWSLRRDSLRAPAADAFAFLEGAPEELPEPVTEGRDFVPGQPRTGRTAASRWWAPRRHDARRLPTRRGHR